MASRVDGNDPHDTPEEIVVFTSSMELPKHELSTRNCERSKAERAALKNLERAPLATRD
jgi:hypothetical protein